MAVTLSRLIDAGSGTDSKSVSATSWVYGQDFVIDDERPVPVGAEDPLAGQRIVEGASQ